MVSKNKNEQLGTSASQFFVDIEPTDRFNGYQILKRGPVAIHLSVMSGPSVRQLILCGNQMLMVLRTPSQLLRSMTEDQFKHLK